MLAGAKNLTAEREGKLKDKDKRNMLDFSNAEVNFQVRSASLPLHNFERC